MNLKGRGKMEQIHAMGLYVAIFSVCRKLEKLVHVTKDERRTMQSCTNAI